MDSRLAHSHGRGRDGLRGPTSIRPIRPRHALRVRRVAHAQLVLAELAVRRLLRRAAAVAGRERDDPGGRRVEHLVAEVVVAVQRKRVLRVLGERGGVLSGKRQSTPQE